MFAKIILSAVLLILIGGVAFFALNDPQIVQKNVSKTVTAADIQGLSAQ